MVSFLKGLARRLLGLAALVLVLWTIHSGIWWPLATVAALTTICVLLLYRRKKRLRVAAQEAALSCTLDATEEVAEVVAEVVLESLVDIADL